MVARTGKAIIRRTPQTYCRQRARCASGNSFFHNVCVNFLFDKKFATKNLHPSEDRFTGHVRILRKTLLLHRVSAEVLKIGEPGTMGMKQLLTIIAFAFLIATPLFGREDLLLARITVYWPGEGQVRACSNGARLRAGHCAVDPKRVPFGSQVLFPDATCLAVDSGPAVVSRKAARASGRTASQRDAIVIDRFFESKEAALVWANSHPQFMTVRVVHPGSDDKGKPSAVAESRSNVTRTVALPKTSKLQPKVTADGMEIAAPTDALVPPNRRKTS